MPIRTRRELLKLAERYRVPDRRRRAPIGELYFHEAPPPSLRDLDAQNLVIHSEQLLEGDGAGTAPRLAVGRAVDRRSDRDHQAAARSAHAEPRAVRDGAADSRGQLRCAICKTLRAEHARRCATMVTAIQRHLPPGALRFAAPQGGLYLGAGSHRASAHARCSNARSRPASRSSPAHAFYPDPAGRLRAAPVLLERHAFHDRRGHQTAGGVSARRFRSSSIASDCMNRPRPKESHRA